MSFPRKSRLPALLATSLALLTACGGGGGGGGSEDTSDRGNGAPSATPAQKWTYLVYMGGDNNLSSAALVDINEMESVAASNDINLVVQAEFSNTFSNFEGSYDGQTVRMKVSPDNDPTGINIAGAQKIGHVDMGSPAALTDFIRWATTQYPAENYALVIWDHGAGWKTTRLAPGQARGAVQDETAGTFMSLPQLAQGVRDSGIKMDLINFDACLMAMYEVAYEFTGLTDYMVFSEDIEPGDGDPYDTILSELVARPGMNAKELSGLIVDKFQAFYQNSPRGEAVTKSAVDMAAIPALHESIRSLASAIETEKATVAPVIEGAQNNTQRYQYPENHDLRDFAQYLTNNLVSGATREAAQAVISAVDAAVIANKTTGTSQADSHGLAIYLPAANQVSADNAQDDFARYAELAINSPAAGSWHAALQSLTSGTQDTVLNSGGFAFYLEWNTDADLDLFVWEPCQPQNSLACEDTLYAPYMGPTTPNGYFSGDSADTGVSEEYYVANEYVEAGTYDVLINYYADGSANYAMATLWYVDPANGVNEWTMLADPVQLDLVNNPAPAGSLQLDLLNTYSDWWYPLNTTRAMKDNRPVQIAVGGKTITLHLQQAKKTGPVITTGKL